MKNSSAPWLFALAVASLAWPSGPLRAGDFEMVQFKLDPLVEDLIRSNASLQEGAIRFVKIKGKLCLLATHFAEAEDAGFRSSKSAQKAAALECKKEIVGFLAGTKISASDFVSMSEVTTDDVSKLTQTFSSRTKAEIEGMIDGVRQMGSWKVKGEPAYFVALLLPVEGRLAGGMKPPPATADPDEVATAKLARWSSPAPGSPAKLTPSEIVVVTVGRYAFMGNPDLSRDRAIQEACQEAIKQGLGEFLTSSEIVSNSRLIESKILSQTEGFISRYKVLTENVENDEEYVVKIEAVVTKEKLKSEAMKVGLLKSQVGNPKVSIIAIETVDGKVYREDTAPLMTMLNGQFAEFGIRPTDMRQTIAMRKTQDPKLWARFEEMMSTVGDALEPEFDIQSFGRLGIGADIIVVGRSTAKHLGKDSDGIMDRFECTVTLKIMYAGTAEILATVVDSKTAVADNPNTALINVCKKLAPKVHDLLPKTVQQWQDMVNNGQRILLTVKDFPSRRVGRKFKRGLADLPKVKQVEVSVQESDYMDIDVTFKGSPSNFTELLEDWLDENIEGWVKDESYDFELSRRGGKIVVTFIKDS